MTDRERKMLQKCLVCGYEAIWTIKTQSDEFVIRANSLPCGHQGLFTLQALHDQQERKIG